MSPYFFVSFFVICRVYGFELLERQSSNCTEECAVSLNATLTCAPSPEPFCGCPDFLSGAPTCKQCLAINNVTLAGFFNSTYVEFIQAVCSCQLPSCGNLTLAEKQCSDSTDPFCTCPARQADAPDCYACIRQHTNDPIILAGLNAAESVCNVSTAAPSASGSGSASPSPVPTFTGEGHVNGIQLHWIGLALLLACLIQ